MKLMTIIFVLLTNIFFAASSVLFKLALNKIGKIEFSSIKDSLSIAVKLVGSPLFFAGIASATVGSGFYYILLSRMNLSIAYPLLSLAYIFVTFGSIIFCKESISLHAWIGIAFVCVGVALVSAK
jgi:undecaprenyl phosphate-alpha-L-ara4N flippase subunit ArnE